MLKYKDWVAVAASYNAGQARIASQLAKQDVDDSLDLQLVEETARYVYRILAAKQLFSALLLSVSVCAHRICIRPFPIRKSL